MINNFSAAGGNSSILVQEAPIHAAKDVQDKRPIYPIAVSAKSSASLKGNLQNLIAFVRQSGEEDLQLPRLSYTTTARRIHHHHRVLVQAENIADLVPKLEDALANCDNIPRVTHPKSVLFAFTGQGSQYAGMGKQLFETLSEFRKDLTHFDGLCQRAGFPSILPMFRAQPGHDVMDFPPVVVQLANTCMQIALARVWKSWGLLPTAVVGHSLGEYAALNVAGVLSDLDTIFLVGRRAELMQSRCNKGTHSMLAVMTSPQSIRRALGSEPYEVACINGPEETVLAGPSARINELQQKLSKAGLRCKLLKVPYAFHSSQITPILSSFEDQARGCTFHEPAVPVLSPLLNKAIKTSGIIGPEYLSRHCREPVNMHESLLLAKYDGTITDQTCAVEFGPHPVVSGMISSSLGPKITVLPTLRRNTSPWKSLAQTASTLQAHGIDINWDEYHRDFPSSQVVLDLPRYHWELKPYWIKYRNDWTLTKRDIAFDRSATSIAEPPAVMPSRSAPKATVDEVETPKPETTTVHRTHSESTTQDGRFEITFESDVSRTDLDTLVKGHTVDEIPLCTPSVYADIAFTLGDYLKKRFGAQLGSCIVDIGDMDLQKALVARGGGPQLLRSTAILDSVAKQASCRFFSVDGAGRETMQHSVCIIRFLAESLRPRMQQKLPGIQTRFQQMKSASNDGKIYRFNGNMAYNMVRELAQFPEEFHCIDETILDNDKLEAACTVSFGGFKKGGTFHTHPAYIDGLTQSGGFIMNAHDKVDLSKTVYVNHGWESFQIWEPISDKHQYKTHVKMHPAQDSQYRGDIICFLDDRVVAFVGGVCLQGVPRRVLAYMLKSTAKETTGKTDSKQLKQQSKQQSSKLSSTSALVSDRPSATSTVTVASSLSVPQVNAITNNQGKGSSVSAPPLRGTEGSGSAITGEVLQIICEESGIERTSLTDDTILADVGVDSLLTLVIGGRIREELEIDVDVDCVFSEWKTVKDVKRFFDAQQDPAAASSATLVARPLTSAVPSTPAPNGIDQMSTLASENELEMPMPSNEVEFDGAGRPTSRYFSSENPEIVRQALAIIAEEAMVSIEELKADLVLTDIGVDSLLTLVIAGRFREEIESDVDLGTVLDEALTIADLKQRLGYDGVSTPSESSTSSQPSGASSMVDMQGTELSQSSLSRSDSQLSVVDLAPTKVAPTTSVVLQGSPKTAAEILFFFPDGGGTATSYASIPRLRSDLAVIGLNSPYLKNASEMTCTWDDLVRSYLAEVRRRQPHGPYHFGGWSAGGSLAYRAMQFLLAEGEQVKSLILLDAPAPEGLGTLPEHFFEYCEKNSLIGSNGKAPPRLIPHFRATNRVLSTYFATPLIPGRAYPKVSLMWATRSVLDWNEAAPFKARPGDPEDMKFLTEPRKDFSPGGWARLFPGQAVNVVRAEGAHHFNMLVSPMMARSLSATIANTWR